VVLIVEIGALGAALVLMDHDLIDYCVGAKKRKAPAGREKIRRRAEYFRVVRVFFSE
jgi:hypothetical protein